MIPSQRFQAVPVREDVDQLGGEIGVQAIGGGEEMDDDRTRDLQIMRERITAEDEHVIAHLDRALIVDTPGDDLGVAAVAAAERRHGVLRVIDERIGRLVVGWVQTEPAIAVQRVRPAA